jgi:hypothetical protein
MPAIIFQRRGGEDIGMGSSGCGIGANRGSSRVETWPRGDPTGVRASGEDKLNNIFCWLDGEKKPGGLEADDDDEGAMIYNEGAMMFEGRKSPRGLLPSTTDGGLGERSYRAPCVVLVINDNPYGLMIALSYMCRTCP